MISLPDTLQLLTEVSSQMALWILSPLAVIEGPVVTLIAGWLISLGVLAPLPTFLVVLVGDVLGDLILYAIGRGGAARVQRWLPARLRPSRRVIAQLIRRIRRNDAGLLIAGKLTHAAGFAALLAAGIARMPLHRFILWNSIAAAPKAAVLLLLGWAFGAAHEQIADWISTGSLALLLLIAALGGLWFLAQKRETRT